MRVINLGSGSKGNSTLIEHNNTKLLIDAGLTKKDLEERLRSVGVEFSDITAIIVSHNHIDHIKCVGAISKKYSTAVYAPSECFFDPKLETVPIINRHIIGLDNFVVGDIMVETFEVPHDALKTIGFVFYADGNKVSLVTDAGEINDLVVNRLKESNLIMIESNYDKEMLKTGPYPTSLKKRISSNMGHLSNEDCANVIAKLSRLGSNYFMLMHLSEINNTPEIAYNTTMNRLYNEYDGEINVKVFLSYQHKISPNFVFKKR